MIRVSVIILKWFNKTLLELIKINYLWQVLEFLKQIKCVILYNNIFVEVVIFYIYKINRIKNQKNLIFWIEKIQQYMFSSNIKMWLVIISYNFFPSYMICTMDLLKKQETSILFGLFS